MIEFDSDVVRMSASAILGAVIYNIMNRMMDGKGFVKEHTVLREELREELDVVRQQVAGLRAEVDTWREKYYHQVEVTAGLQAELTVMRFELEEYKDRFHGDLRNFPSISDDSN